jgi:hypothetical protein
LGSNFYPEILLFFSYLESENNRKGEKKEDYQAAD